MPPTTRTERPETVAQVARRHYLAQAALAAAASRAAATAWADLDLSRIGSSWLELSLGRLLMVLERLQLNAAIQGRDYVDRVLAARERRRPPQVRSVPASRPRVVPQRLVGVASDGRGLWPLLFRPAVTTLRAVELGRPPRVAAAAGAAQLDMIVRTQIADTGRTATGVEIAAAPTLGYIRMVNPPACARCIILAGRFYRWNAGFQRHPNCDCVHIPASEDQADDLTTDPRRHFSSLDEAEQRRRFGRAGAQAIREGADVARVVNARRGMYTAGGRRYTTEGARGRRARLMPEQIYREAAGNRDEAIRLLRLHGYLT